MLYIFICMLYIFIVCYIYSLNRMLCICYIYVVCYIYNLNRMLYVVYIYMYVIYIYCMLYI